MNHAVKIRILFNMQIFVTYWLAISYKIEQSRNLLIINKIKQMNLFDVKKWKKFQVIDLQ